MGRLVLNALPKLETVSIGTHSCALFGEFSVIGRQSFIFVLVNNNNTIFMSGRSI